MRTEPRPGSGAQPTKAEAGFTLIEVLVVLAVVGLAFGLLIGGGPWRSTTLDARAAAGQVAQGLRLARAQAIASNRRVVFALDVATSGFRIGEGELQALPRGLDLSLTAVAEETRASRVGGIVFLPDGSSTGGRIGLASGRVRSWVGVDWLTGRVSVTDAP